MPTKFISAFVVLLLSAIAAAESPPEAKGHAAFIKGLREIEGNASKELGGKSASNPRTLSPVV